MCSLCLFTFVVVCLWVTWLFSWILGCLLRFGCCGLFLLVLFAFCVVAVDPNICFEVDCLLWRLMIDCGLVV